MTDLFLHLLNMSLTASWLVLAVLVLRLAFKKAPRWLLCLLWGMVALRLLLPFSLGSALSLIPNPQPVPPDIAITDTPVIDTGIPLINETVNPILSETFTPPVENTGTTPMQILLNVVSVVWLVGVALMLLYSLFSYLRLYVKVRTSLLREEKVYYCDAIAFPFILGIFRPRIYLPSGMPEDQVGYIIRHERAHLSRRDHWWKPLGYLLLSIYWFNPIIWVAYILLCRDIEMACDEKVIKDMSSAAKVGYSEALVACSIQRRMILACPLAFGEVSVKQRIRSVLNYKKPAFWVLLAAIVASIALVVCFLTNPRESTGLYGNVSASKLTDAQARELLTDLVPRQIELEFIFADDSPETDSTQTYPLDENFWLSTDERFSSIQDIRDRILGVMTEESAKTLYYHYLDGPFDSPEDGPEFLEYEGKLYVNMYAGGKGFSTSYLFDTARIVERTRNSVTVEMNTQLFGTDDSFIYTPTLVKTKGGWRLDSSLGEGYDYESANELRLSVGEAPADSIRFTDTTVPEPNYTLLIRTSKTVTDLKLLALVDSESLSAQTFYHAERALFSLEKMTPEDTLALSTYVNDVTINRAIAYRDDKGVLRHYAIQCDMSGTKESPYLREMAYYEVEYDVPTDNSAIDSTDQTGSTTTSTTTDGSTTATDMGSESITVPSKSTNTAATSGSTAADTPTTCPHLYEQWVQEKAPSCDSKGIKIRRCVYCGIEEKTSVAQLEHLESDWIVDAVATTQQVGAQHTECVYCKQTMNTKTIPKVKANHSHTGSRWVVTAYPGCTTTGSQSYLCACGATVQTALIPAAGHTEVTDNGIAATCARSGLTEGSHCSVCNAVTVKQQTIAALPHTVVIDPGVSATCTESGLTEGSHCSVCHTVIQQQQTIAALKHNVTDRVIDPTATDQGYTLHTCTVCGSSYKDTYTAPTNNNATVFNYRSNYNGTCNLTGISGAVPEHVVIPQYNASGEKVVAIGNSAFANQTGIQEVTLPSGVKTIGEKAFSGCTALTAVHGSQQLTTVGVSAFLNCSALTAIDLSGATTIKDSALHNCSSLTNVQLSQQLKAIPYAMFRGCTALTTVDLSSASVINGYALYGCSSLTDVRLNTQLDTIPDSLFGNCKALTTIDLPDSITLIADGAFSSSGIQTIALPSRLVTIGNSAFQSTPLRQISLPETVTTLSMYAFRYCSALERVDFSKNLTYIGASAFERCSALTDVVLPNGLQTIGRTAFFNCTGLNEIHIPDSVTSLGDTCFANCSGLETVVLPQNLTLIPDRLFMDCTALTAITIPDSVTKIGHEAFCNTALVEVTIPKAVTSVGDNVFSFCPNLQAITYEK